LRYFTKEKSIAYIKLVNHHDFFYYVDGTDDLTYEDKIWKSFNYKEFDYGIGGAYERELVSLSPELIGFINHYSTTAIEEDKAEIYQFLITTPLKALKNQDDIIARKANYLMG
jgi:hypothetical protein